MPDGSDHIREFLKAEIGSIHEESDRLQKSLLLLDSGMASQSRSGRRRTNKARRSGSKRAARGQRPKQFLAAATANPKAGIEEIAKEIGISTAQARGVARRLEAKGRLKRSRKGFRVSAAAK